MTDCMTEPTVAPTHVFEVSTQAGDWEELTLLDGRVLLGGHTLRARDVVAALKPYGGTIEYHTLEILSTDALIQELLGEDADPDDDDVLWYDGYVAHRSAYLQAWLARQRLAGQRFAHTDS